MKIALVHDYLAQDGGAERVLKAFHEIWPEAPIFVLFHKKGKVGGFEEATIKQSFIGKVPFAKNHYRLFLPWMPLATERHNVHEYDVVISSTSAFAKGILTRPETLHISYCHTPTRYLWTDTHEYIKDLQINRALKSFLPRLIHKLRLWDKMSADRVDTFIANSNTVRERIQKYYRRDADIIFPPVDTHIFSVSSDVKNYFVCGGRMVKYKRFDLIVNVFNRLKLPLKIYGDGPELAYLKHHAKDNIEFLGRISDEEKAEVLRHARAFVHPQLEDLGITPIEAMASGCPVIAFGEGGVTETVIPGVTGVFFAQQTWESLLDTVLHFDDAQWNRDVISAHAQKFSVTGFKKKMTVYIEEHYKKFMQERNQCQLEIR